MKMYVALLKCMFHLPVAARSKRQNQQMLYKELTNELVTLLKRNEMYSSVFWDYCHIVY
jgi:hypothetical protein